MSKQYDEYLIEHKQNVKKAYDWLKENMPEILVPCEQVEWLVDYAHDASKNDEDEYDAYDKYFYGNNKSYQVVQDFNIAWLKHIHKNPHHWQHWVLINDDDGANNPLEIPYIYIIEMLCDWWSFSFKTGKLDEIFKWYEDRKEIIVLHPDSRKTLENILELIRTELEE